MTQPAFNAGIKGELGPAAARIFRGEGLHAVVVCRCGDWLPLTAETNAERGRATRFQRDARDVSAVKQQAVEAVQAETELKCDVSSVPFILIDGGPLPEWRLFHGC